MKPQHSPTPYHIVKNLQEQHYDSAAPYTHELWTADGEQPVCKLVDDADAEFVSRAVNAYEQDQEEIARLKKIIKDSRQYWEGFTDGENEAIARAGGAHE